MSFVLTKHFKIYALYAAFLLFIITTNPDDLHIGWLLVPLVILFLALYQTFQLALKSRVASSLRRRLMAGIIAATPVSLMVLSSIGQLTMRDSLIVLAFALVGLFYVSRVDP